MRTWVVGLPMVFRWVGPSFPWWVGPSLLPLVGGAIHPWRCSDGAFLPFLYYFSNIVQSMVCRDGDHDGWETIAVVRAEGPFPFAVVRAEGPKSGVGPPVGKSSSDRGDHERGTDTLRLRPASDRD